MQVMLYFFIGTRKLAKCNSTITKAPTTTSNSLYQIFWGDYMNPFLYLVPLRAIYFFNLFLFSSICACWGLPQVLLAPSSIISSNPLHTVSYGQCFKRHYTRLVWTPCLPRRLAKPSKRLANQSNLIVARHLQLPRLLFITLHMSKPSQLVHLDLILDWSYI